MYCAAGKHEKTVISVSGMDKSINPTHRQGHCSGGTIAIESDFVCRAVRHMLKGVWAKAGTVARLSRWRQCESCIGGRQGEKGGTEEGDENSHKQGPFMSFPRWLGRHFAGARCGGCLVHCGGQQAFTLPENLQFLKEEMSAYRREITTDAEQLSEALRACGTTQGGS
jgi:Arc/MetJ family transcription regulator